MWVRAAWKSFLELPISGLEASLQAWENCGGWAGEAVLSREEGGWGLLGPEATSIVGRMLVTRLPGVDWDLQAAWGWRF